METKELLVEELSIVGGVEFTGTIVGTVFTGTIVGTEKIILPVLG